MSLPTLGNTPAQDDPACDPAVRLVSSDRSLRVLAQRDVVEPSSRGCVRRFQREVLCATRRAWVLSAFVPHPSLERGPSSAQLFPRPKDGRSPGGAALRGRAGPCSADPCQRRPDARRRQHARSAALQVSPHRCKTPCRAAAPVQGQCREPRGLRRRTSGSNASLSSARPPRSVSPATARVADIVMAVPKKRQSKMKTRQRKANVRAPADAAALSACCLLCCSRELRACSRRHPALLATAVDGPFCPALGSGLPRRGGRRSWRTTGRRA